MDKYKAQSRPLMLVNAQTPVPSVLFTCIHQHQHRPTLPFYTACTKPSIKCSVSGLWSNPHPPKPRVGPPLLPGLTTCPKHAPRV